MRGILRTLGVAAAACAATAAAAAPASLPAQAPNPVVVENARAGSTGWDVGTAPAGEIEGFATETSVAPGETIHFHVAVAPGFRYRVELYRLGWYGGAGGRLVGCSPSCSGDEVGPAQPPASGDGDATPIVAPWRVTDAIAVPADAPSGYYEALFSLTNGRDQGSAARTFVIVRQDATTPPSQILVQVPVNTWQAYNQWGGKSLYDFGGPRAKRVSFERPYGATAQSPLWYEVQLVRFLEREGYDVSYQTDVDTDRDQASLLRHRLVIVNGHDEYWTIGIRNAFDNALAAGTNLAFVGSNVGYWVVRYEDGGTTIFTLKSASDPNPDPSQRTAMFREIGRPECELMAVEHTDFAHHYSQPLDFTVTAAGAADPWLASTGLGPGDRIAGVVGREYDALAPWGGCFHPFEQVLFHYDGAGVNQNADAVRYTATSGARVFAAGAQRLSWALDGWRSDLDRNMATVPVSPGVQQFMRNALDDLTRPAPPNGVVVTRAAGGLTVSVAQPVDPRVTGFTAGAWTGSRWVRLCRGTTTCTRRLPAAAPPQLKIGVVAVDGWGRRSCAAFAFG